MLHGMLMVEPASMRILPLLRSCAVAATELLTLSGERVRLELLVKKTISFVAPVTVLVKGLVSVVPVLPIL